MSTVIAGVLVFVISQLLMKFVIEPAYELKKELGSLTNTFLRRANGENSFTMSAEAAFELKGHAAALLQGLWSVPFYNQVRCLFGLPKALHIIQAAKDLNYISCKIDESSYYKSEAEKVSLYASGEFREAMARLVENLAVVVVLQELTQFLKPNSEEKPPSHTNSDQ